MLRTNPSLFPVEEYREGTLGHFRPEDLLQNRIVLSVCRFEQVKRSRDNGRTNVRNSSQDVQGFTRPAPPEVKQSDVFYTQLNALSTLRSIKTRRLAQAEDNPELTKVARLAYVFKDLYNAVVTAKGLLF